MGEIIKLKAYKYPNIPHYEWEGELIEQTEDYVLVLCKYGRRLKHYTKNTTFTIENTSLEYFSLKEWFTAAMDISEDKVLSYYCNVAMPSKLTESGIQFVDLDLDYVKRRESEWEVVDVDEFEENSVKYGYSDTLKKAAIKALELLQVKVSNQQFPFNEQPLEILYNKKIGFKEHI